MLLQQTNVSAKTFLYRITRFFTLVCDVQFSSHVEFVHVFANTGSILVKNTV